jgi:uncharacterized protein (TIGR00369 family)
VSLEQLQRIISGDERGAEVAHLIGMRMVAAEPGRVTFELDVGPQHTSPPGNLHGGILCDLADGAMGCAVVSLLEDGQSFATVELKINFLKPVWEGTLTAVGRVLKAGRTLTLCECRVTDAGGSLVAFATSTCMTVEPRVN